MPPSAAPAQLDWNTKLGLPAGTDPGALALVLVGLLLLYLPTYYALARTVWASDEQGHGPIILLVSLWLLYRSRERIAAGALVRRAVWPGALLFTAGLVCYVFGRSQSVLLFEVGSQIPVFAGLILIFCGWAGLKPVWFALFFLLFMIPLPEVLVSAVTTPLKSAVSAVAAQVLYAAGYPVGRAGVTLTIGQFQLLVADACAGLNSMFTLEALGLLYLNLMSYASALRNLLLALLVIPISFVSNVVRVMILVLVTYHFGDEAGQGFVHGFAGMVLFAVALALMLATDGVLAVLVRQRPARP